MGIDRRRRASLALTLNFLALFLAVSALTTSYWCEGTRKVMKPFCTGPVTATRQSFCIRFNSSNLNDTRLVQYIWESGEDKYVMRKFHTGIWFSCEQNINMTGEFPGLRRAVAVDGWMGRWMDGCWMDGTGARAERMQDMRAAPGGTMQKVSFSFCFQEEKKNYIYIESLMRRIIRATPQC